MLTVRVKTPNAPLVFFSHRKTQMNRFHKSTQIVTPPPTPPFGGGDGGGANWLLVCEVTFTGLLTRGVSKHFFHAGEFFLSQSAQSSRRFLAHISSPQDSGPSPNPSPAGRDVICEVTHIGLLVWGVGSLFFYAGYFFSHRTHRFNRTSLRTFRTHRTPPAYRYHRTL